MMTISKPIKILLVDDYWRMRESLRGLQSLDPNLQIIAEAENDQQALSCVQNQEIDLVIMDYQLKGSNHWGVELAKQLLEVKSNIKIILWSVHVREIDIRKAKEAGVHGYVFKEIPNIEIKQVIEKVMQGGTSWLELFQPQKLTKTESWIMEQLAQGKAYRNIADESLALEFEELDDEIKANYKDRDEYLMEVHTKILVHSKKNGATIDEYKDQTRWESRTRTIEGHIKNIKEKLGIRSRGDLFSAALMDYGPLEKVKSIHTDFLPREMAIMELLAEGKTAVQIAEEFEMNEPDVLDIIAKHSANQ